MSTEDRWRDLLVDRSVKDNGASDPWKQDWTSLTASLSAPSQDGKTWGRRRLEWLSTWSWGSLIFELFLWRSSEADATTGSGMSTCHFEAPCGLHSPAQRCSASVGRRSPLEDLNHSARLANRQNASLQQAHRRCDLLRTRIMSTLAAVLRGILFLSMQIWWLGFLWKPPSKCEFHMIISPCDISSSIPNFEKDNDEGKIFIKAYMQCE